MKIVHICSSINGGAGTAAYRLHYALQKKGIDSVMLTRRNSVVEQSIYKFKRPFFSRFLEYFIQPNGRLKYKSYMKKKANDFHALSFPDALYDLSKSDILKDADIVHLHWVGCMLNYLDFFAHIHVPVVWTLHDMNPFMGIAHCAHDYEKHKNDADFAMLEKSNLILKKKAYDQCKSITLVCLCEWMRDLSLQSLAFRNREHRIIRNCIEESWFEKREGPSIRLKYNLPPNRKLLLFVSQTKSSMKGTNLIQHMISHLDDNCCLVCVGKQIEIEGERVINIGYVADINKMMELYSCADALLLPSLQDNLPNTMLESLSCGTPVITFPICGMKDIIKDGENGIFAQNESSAALFDAIKRFLKEGVSCSRERIREEAYSLFSSHQVAAQYIDLYQDLI